MTDLKDLLSATEPREFKFLGRTVRLHVYSAGAMRCSDDDAEVIDAAQEGDGSASAKNLKAMRAVIPRGVASWEWSEDGQSFEPIIFDGKTLEPTDEGVLLCPPSLLGQAYKAFRDIWLGENFTEAESSPTGSAQTESR